MRLTCPNCGAQYEVPDEVIPESGRDVQCSNCGDTWFQHHPDHAPDPDDTETDELDWDTPPKPDPESPDTDDMEPVGDEASERVEDPDEETEDDAPQTRRELDPAVSGLLREEAERERAARAADTGSGLETQPELGLSEGTDDADKRSAEAQARMARLRGDPETAEDEDDGPDPGARRNLLPDIDEINSSLDSDTTDPGMIHTGEPDDLAATSRPGGFRRGFLTMVVLAVIGLLLYIFAPQLAGAVPALDGALAGYVDMVNGLRGWLSQTVGGLTGATDGISSEGS